jgi:hypothetical protein
MGREIKRVAMDFSWPPGKTWEGYLNPHHRKCPDCDHGQTPAGEMLGAIVSLIMVAGENGLTGPVNGKRNGRLWPHPYLRHIGCHSFDFISADMAELSTGLAGRGPDFMGHDSCDRWAATHKIIEAAGLDPKKWGVCKTCGGDAIDPAIRAQYEAWTKTEPPAGKGWQMWETVSEGSPVSPVFATPIGLEDWLVKDWYSRAAARAFIKSGWVPSMLAQDGQLYEGIESAPLLKGGE